MVKYQEDIQKTINRPIFQNLYNLKYKSDPEKYQNASYEGFLDKIREKPEVIDENKVDEDEYNAKIQLVQNDFYEDLATFEYLKLGNQMQEVHDDLQLNEVIQNEKNKSLQDEYSKIRDYIYKKPEDQESQR